MESGKNSFRNFDGMPTDDSTIWATTSNEISSSQMYITVDTTEAFPDMPSTVVIDNDTMMINPDGQLSDPNVIFVESSPMSYNISDSQQFEFQGKISVVESTSSHGLFCGECSARLESPVSFFQHWVTHHCQLEQPTPIVKTDEDSTATLTMERCNRCNHIFVEGTQRYKHHLHTCEQNSSSVDAVSEKPVDPSTLTSTTVTPSVTASTGGGVSRTKRLKSSSSNKYVCGVCEAGVKTVTSFFLHWLESHQGLKDDILQEVWQCRGCSGSKLFLDCVSLKSHIDNDHPHVKPKDSDQVRCCPIPECLARLGGEDDVGVHLGQFHRQLLPDEDVICPVCPKVFKCTKEAYGHFRSDHQMSCSFCTCDISIENSRDHFLSRHRCEVIWNRKDSLQKVSRSPQVSRICTGANQVPVRLANGAIAKATTLKRDTPATTPRGSFASLTVIKSTKYTLLKGDANDPSDEKGYKCSKCSQVYTNLKVMERHYLSNHEFQCKFCSAVMDKDVYGQHLRQHLASERRKTLPATTATSSSSSPPPPQTDTSTSVQLQFFN